MIQTHPRHYITFTLLHLGEEHSVKTYWGEYRDLRALIADRLLLEDFGQCGGMGRCATCLIEISGLSGEDAILKRNEAATLSKIGPLHLNVRLSCQIPVTDELANMVVLVF